MTLVVQTSNSKVKKLLTDYGKIVYESTLLDLVYLEIYNVNDITIVESLPGVLSVREETTGSLMIS